MDKPEQNPDGTLVNSPYAPDYTGLSSAPFSDEARRILAECPNHEDVEVKPDGICYMPGVWYRRQLTRAFGAGAWALKPTGPARTVGNAIEWPGALYILGRWVAEAVGGQATSDWMSHADSIQGAKTDCLSKCCGHGLAMASELWDKTWREAWLSEYTTKEWKDPPKDKPNAKGKWVFKLKAERQPKAANLMGNVATAGSGALSSPADAPSAGTTASSPDTGEAADDATYAAIQTEMKRLGFRNPVATAFLGKFGVDKVSALTKVQAEEALAQLRAGA